MNLYAAFTLLGAIYLSIFVMTFIARGGFNMLLKMFKEGRELEMKNGNDITALVGGLIVGLVVGASFGFWIGYVVKAALG